ncbi:cadmium transporter [Arsenicicoccus sp. MKL-02]|uniref:Cadmium transporter n=3 Tax=Actinomycetes TaxID=1760 RepID=A0A6I3IFG0_9MICO|nr:MULTISPECIES: cadmium resistance transporter [Actinomycetes]AKT50938.1 cadmium transporter [Arsenicicoccus sp. oral taxon 190]MTB73018.1 cadmium transporter [Arsenicicoccus cauae]
MMLATMIQAVGLFVATNIDDVIVLSLFFARGAGRAGTTRRIVVGQYLGFLGILGAALLTTWGASLALPESAIPYFGLIPLLLGLRAAWEAWQGEDDDELDDRKKVAPLTVAAVTFANGGDNIGVYVPVFLSVSPASILTYSAVFLLFVAVLVAIAKFVATRPGIDESLEKSEHILFPLVLIILGVVILVQGGAFGL